MLIVSPLMIIQKNIVNVSKRIGLSL